MKSIPGQMNLFEYTKVVESPKRSCDCVCKNCLYWWSSRCPYGRCYDDKRAQENPFDERFPEETPRTLWSDWNKPGEQKYWCRGGSFYPVFYCEKFVKYKGCSVKDCIKGVVQVYQDGYISCSLVDTIGCEACYQELRKKVDE